MTALPRIRVLVVDDHALVREGIRQTLLAAQDLEVVGEAATGEDGVRLARELGPDVVVMDISLPGESGLKSAARIRAECPGSRVLMLSVHDHPEYVLESVRAGAHGYLRKDTLPDQLRGAIRVLHEGQTCFAAGTEPDTAPSGATHALDLLTRRERDVLIGVASGRSNKEIAAHLDLSARTVESYRESLMQKLGIHTVAGLTRFALDADLLAGPPP